jgi:hypothetical protein
MTQTVTFTRTDGPGTTIAARNLTPAEAADLVAALLRLPHIATAQTV